LIGLAVKNWLLPGIPKKQNNYLIFLYFTKERSCLVIKPIQICKITRKYELMPAIVY
jgi:hypothetical protein